MTTPEPTVDDRAVRLAAEVGRLTVEVERERGTVDFLLAQKAGLVAEVERLRATVARVEALAEAAPTDGIAARLVSTYQLRAALDGARV